MEDNIIKIDYDNIDVEDIMRQIRDNISKRNYSREELNELEKENCITVSEDDFDTNAFAEYIAINNTHWSIQLAGNIRNEKRFIGPLIVLFKRAVRKLSYWYVKFLFNQQIEFNASVTNSINQIDRYIKSEKAEMDQQNKYYIRKINNLKEDLLRLSKDACRISEENHKLMDITNKLENDNLYLKSENRELKDNIESLKEDTKKELDNYLKKHENIDMDYTQFEKKFRGNREEMKNRQSVYLKYFENKSNVIDIGCGRGEFVELLIENKVNATGIDMNNDNITYCCEKGLPVKLADAVEYLGQCKDSSLGGIFMSQVAEHLLPNELISIIKLAKKKLQTGAYIVIETINPKSLIVFTESYYMDPTHIKLIHPLTLKFLIENEGFSDIEVLYVSPVAENNKLPRPEQDGLNETISKLNDLIYGNRDYSVIAKKCVDKME